MPRNTSTREGLEDALNHIRSLHVDEIRRRLKPAYERFERESANATDPEKRPDSPHFFYNVEEIKRSNEVANIMGGYRTGDPAVDIHLESRISQAIHLDNRFRFAKNIRELLREYEGMTPDEINALVERAENAEGRVSTLQEMIDAYNGRTPEDVQNLIHRTEYAERALGIWKELLRREQERAQSFQNDSAAERERADNNAEALNHRNEQYNELNDYADRLEAENERLEDRLWQLQVVDTELKFYRKGQMQRLREQLSRQPDMFDTEELPARGQSPETDPDEYVRSLFSGQLTTPAQPAVDAHVQERQTPEEMLRLAKEAYNRGDYSSASIFACLAIDTLRESYVFDSDKKMFIAQDDEVTKEAKELQNKLEEIYVL